MPNSEQKFRLNWAVLGYGDKRQEEGPDYTIFVGDLAVDVSDYLLQETFKAVYPSVKGAKVVTDRTTGRSKGYGFVRFGNETEQIRAMTEMNGIYCSTRAMRIGPAANKKPLTGQQYQKGTHLVVIIYIGCHMKFTWLGIVFICCELCLITLTSWLLCFVLFLGFHYLSQICQSSLKFEPLPLCNKSLVEFIESHFLPFCLCKIGPL